MPQNKLIIIPTFKGGLANSLYEPLENGTFQTAKDLEIFTPYNTLNPHLKLSNDTGTSNTNRIQAIIKASAAGGTGDLYFGLGNSGVSNQRRLFSANTLGSTTTWTTRATSTTANTSPDNNGLRHFVEFRDYLYFHNSDTVLSRFGTMSGTATYTESWQSGLNTMSGTGPLLTHEGLGKLFVGHRNVLADWDNTTWTASRLTLGINWRIKSLAPMGAFLLIGITDVNESQPSKVIIYDGSATTIDDVIDLGDIGLQAVRNNNGQIQVLTMSNPNGTVPFNIMRLYVWSGGRVEKVKEVDLSATVSNAVLIRDTAVDTAKDTLFWGFDADPADSMNIDNGIFAYGKGAIGFPKVVTLDRTVAPVDTTDIEINYVRWIDGDLVINWYDGTNYRTGHITGLTKSGDGIYQSNMFRFDSHRKGRIKRIKINHLPLPALTGFRIGIRHHGITPVGITPSASETFTTDGTGASFVGNQTEDNQTYTIFSDRNGSPFPWADAAQIQIEFNTVSGGDATSIIFPIIIEAEISDEM